MKFIERLFSKNSIMPAISSDTSAPFKVITIVKCSSCDYKEARKFERGYFIFKKIDQCKKCNKGTLYIHNIYAIPLVSRREKKEEEI